MDEQTVHRIAYVTVHGWVHDGDSWSKPGVTRTEVRTEPCGRSCCTREFQAETSEWDLESAYWEERERQDCVRNTMES